MNEPLAQTHEVFNSRGGGGETDTQREREIPGVGTEERRI